jgi:hypothetical protein
MPDDYRALAGRHSDATGKAMPLRRSLAAWAIKGKNGFPCRLHPIQPRTMLTEFPIVSPDREPVAQVAGLSYRKQFNDDIYSSF